MPSDESSDYESFDLSQENRRFTPGSHGFAIYGLMESHNILALTGAFRGQFPNQENTRKDAVAKANISLALLADHCLRLGLPETLKHMLDMLRRTFNSPPLPNGADIASRQSQLNSLILVLSSEIDKKIYVPVLESDRDKHDLPNEWFGINAVVVFTDCREDVVDCAKCLAFGFWTASVFHAMNIVQRGLERLAADWAITIPRHVTASNWGELISALSGQRMKPHENKSIDEREQKRQVQYRSDVVATLAAITDAYRNEVMHARIRYPESDARQIVDASRRFMDKVAREIMREMSFEPYPRDAKNQLKK